MIVSPASAVIGPFPWPGEAQQASWEIIGTRNEKWIYLPLWDETGRMFRSVPYNPGHTYCSDISVRRVGVTNLWEVTLHLRHLGFWGPPAPEMARPTSWNMLWECLKRETHPIDELYLAGVRGEELNQAMRAHRTSHEAAREAFEQARKTCH